MLKLFHAPESRSSRIIWLLEELGAPYVIEYVNISRMNGSGASDPANPHPDKKVPALLHGGSLITESVAVVLYLTDVFPDARIGPRVGEPQRGAYLTWLAYYAGVIEPVLTLQFLKMADHPGLAHVFRGRVEMDARISSALANSEFILESGFSAVDVIFGSLGHFFRSTLPANERVDSYLEACTARPAFARAMARDKKPA